MVIFWTEASIICRTGHERASRVTVRVLYPGMTGGYSGVLAL